MVGESFCLAMVKLAPSPELYVSDPAVTLKEVETVVEVLKLKLLLVPRAGSLGHVAFCVRH